MDDIGIYNIVEHLLSLIPKRDFTHLDASYYSDHDIRAIESVMRNQLYFEESLVDEWMNCIREGYDEPLKGILMALAPRLREGIFVAYPKASGYHLSRHPILFLFQAITSIVTSSNPSWPPGFLALGKISVCSPTDLRHPHDMYYAPAKRVAPLFRLPNLRILMLCLLGYLDNGDQKANLEPASSSIEVLRFHCCSVSDESLLTMMRAARSLKIFQTQFCDDSLMDCLLRIPSKTHSRYSALMET